MSMTSEEVWSLLGEGLEDELRGVEFEHSRLEGDEGFWEYIQNRGVVSANWYFKFIEVEDGYLFEHLPPSGLCKGKVPDMRRLKKEFRHWLESMTETPNPDEA
jgi:hypothetical protein